LTVTGKPGYSFVSWNVYKTSDPETTVTVTSNQFTMPDYAVTVDATFTRSDARKQILYLTTNTKKNTEDNDKLYAALNSVDDYNVIIAEPTSQIATDYELVVMHESLDGNTYYNHAVIAAAKTGNVPVLNTKSYFYPSNRWNWGTPNAGQSVKGATMNTAFSNIASHPIFAGVTATENFFEITDAAAEKCMQPVGSFVAGKEGYTLATTPNNGDGNGAAIHELTPAQRGAASGKYLLISVSKAKLDALNANGQKLFKNAAAYLLGDEAWTPEFTVSVGAKGYATYCNSNYALDFTGKSIKAYIAESASGNTITFSPVDKIAKGEPVLLYSETNSDSQSIPAIAESEATKKSATENYFRAGDGTTAYEWADEDGKRIYVLNTTTKSPGFYKANKNKVATTKAYLSMPAGASARFSGLVFDGETTGISNLNVDDNLDADAPMYNLAGQRVTKSYKGVVIVNGKKMLNK
jgi:hypothetical protein